MFLRSLFQLYITFRDEQLAIKNKRDIEDSSSYGTLAHRLATIEVELARIKGVRSDLLWRFVKVQLTILRMLSLNNYYLPSPYSM